jgi:hypothetical protein
MMLSHSCPRDKLGTKLGLVTQNFNGLKTDDTLDIITNTMEKRDIDILSHRKHGDMAKKGNQSQL